MRELEQIYNESHPADWTAAVGYLVEKGMDAMYHMPDAQIAAIEGDMFASAEYYQSILSLAKEIARACRGDGLTFLTFHVACGHGMVPYHRLDEIATNAITFIQENDLIIDFIDDWGDFEPEEYAYFEIDLNPDDDGCDDYDDYDYDDEEDENY